MSSKVLEEVRSEQRAQYREQGKCENPDREGPGAEKKPPMEACLFQLRKSREGLGEGSADKVLAVQV